MFEGVMDDESGDDDRDELTNERGGKSRHGWQGLRLNSQPTNTVHLYFNLKYVT